MTVSSEAINVGRSREMICQSMSKSTESAAMNETVTQANTLLPRAFRQLFAQFYRDSARCFAYDLQQTNQREIQKPVGCDVLACLALRERGGFSSVIEHVSERRSAAIRLAHIAPPLPPALVLGSVDSQTAACS